jgi:homoserine dehydrogenase
MAEEGAELGDVLQEAQAKGYAEADPSADVDGYDAAYKIAILASIAFGKQVPMEGVYREGIRGVDRLDIHYANVLGYRIKLLGIVHPVGEDAVLARVHPTLIPKSHPLASVNDVYNAVWIQGDFVGDLMFSGRGAGSDPTASAVVGDLIDVGRSMANGVAGSTIPYDVGMKTAPIDSAVSAYYLRMKVQDRPKVLGHISIALGNHEVSLSAMEMRVIDQEANIGEIVFLTHPCVEANFRSALREVEALPMIVELCNWLRVEGAE